MTGADNITRPGEQSGMNRYMYVDGNPVKFRDPGGNIPFGNFFHAASKTIKMIPHAMNNAIGGMAHSFNNFVRGATRSFNHAMRNAGRGMDQQGKDGWKNYDKYKKAQDMIDSGMSMENFLVMLTVALKYGKAKTNWPLFGHNYTGPGNNDPFAKFFTRNRDGLERQTAVVVAAKILLGIPYEQTMAFFNFLPMLRARPRTFVDTISQEHDDQHFGSKAAMSGSNGRYVEAWAQGVFINGRAWRQPIDGVVGGFFASATLTILDQPLIYKEETAAILLFGKLIL